MTRALGFYAPTINAREFEREAAAWAAAVGAGDAAIRACPGSEDGRGIIARACEGETGLELVAFFCHGLSRWIQCGRIGMAEVETLGEVLTPSLAEGAAVVLYCCSCGKDADNDLTTRGDSIADALALALPAGCRVYSHDRKGHTTRNPNVIVHDHDAQRYLVARDDPGWGEWARSCRETEFRFRYPLEMR